MSEATQAGNGGPAIDDEYQVKLARARRRALKRVVDHAMQRGDPAAAANEALALLRADFLWRFELLRSRQRLPALIVPEPLPPPAPVTQVAG